VRETLHGGGLLLQDKSPALVAEILGRVTEGGSLRRAVLASQQQAIASVRATDFGALLLDRLRPVLESPRAAEAAAGAKVPA
jgi:hypothetical protein